LNRRKNLKARFALKSCDRGHGLSLCFQWCTIWSVWTPDLVSWN